MTKAIFYKEWIKTRLFFIGLLLISSGMTIYTLAKMGRVVSFKGADHLWAIMLSKDITFIEQIAYLPIFCGIIIAVSQFVPELTQKRLKLTLHLPYPQNKMILNMLLCGLAEVAIIFAVQIAMISIYSLDIISIELLNRMLLTATPWFLTGFAAYLFTAAVCLEPTMKMRIINLLIMCGTLRIAYLSDIPESYNGIIIPLAIVIILSITLSYRSVIRFKEGCQD